MSWLDTLDRKAELRRRAGLGRRMLARQAGDDLVDLAGNDYLGLSRHPEVVDAATDALSVFGLGATGSRLVRGTTSLHASLEGALARLLGTDAALVYSSGYLANLGAIRALTRRDTVLIIDSHAHASLVDGCRMSGAETVTVPHSDLDAVAEQLDVHRHRPAVVIAESVYSVSGDLAPLERLHQLCQAHNALLLVDEAHAVGVIGPSGAGGLAADGLSGADGVVVTATLSKALGAAGGVVAGPAALVRHLVDTGRTFIYDTALPPAVAAGVLAALRLARTGDDLRAELRDRAAAVAMRLAAAGLVVSTPAAGVVSVTAPGPEAAVAWAAVCRARGVAVGCFRPPSTPDTRSRLRLTINVGVPRDEFDRAVEVIVKAAP